MNHLDLFSGIGGFALGLQRAGFNTVAFCEIEPYAQKVLAKHWPTVPIFQDIHTLNPENLKEAIGDTTIDILTGGYPCQPFSHAGKRGGKDDDRHLWPEIARLLRQMDAAGGKPRWCLFENVAGHITLGLDTVLSDLERLGYTTGTLVIPACAVDARHRRDRLWIICNSNSNSKSVSAIDAEAQIMQVVGHASQQQADRQRGTPEQRRNTMGREAKTTQQSNRKTNHYSPAGSGENVADRFGPGLEGHSGDELRGREPGRESQGQDGQPAEAGIFTGGAIWEPEPAVGRVANGIPGRVDRLRGLGNAVVPQVVEVLGRAIMEA